MNKIILIIGFTAFVLGCGGGRDHDHDHDHETGGHSHKAPHGGILVNVENEFCHLEFLREPGTKRLLMHAMRFHPEGLLNFYAEKIPVKKPRQNKWCQKLSFQHGDIECNCRYRKQGPLQ